MPRGRNAARTARRRFGRPRKAAGLLGIAVPALALPVTAWAQASGQLLESEIPLSTATGRNLGVTERPRPELEPMGLPAGGFRLYPELEVGVGYSTNVTGAESGKRDDGFVDTRARLRALSQWSRHSLVASVLYDGRHFLRTPQQDQDGFLTQLDGQLDLAGDSTVNGTFSYGRSYELQSAGSFPANGAGAVAVDRLRGMLRGAYVINRLRLTLSGDYNRLDYADTVSTTGTTLSLAYRDRSVYRTSLRAEYQLSPDNALFAQVTYRRTDYDTTSIVNNRTSNDYRAMAGVAGDVTSLIRVAAAVGYVKRDYVNPAFLSIDDAVFDVQLNYYATPLTTVSASATRTIEEPSVAGSPGYIATRAGARVDHELLRNLTFYLLGDYEEDRFRNVDRADSYYRIALGGDFMPRRGVTVGPRLNYYDRRSRGAARGPRINDFRATALLNWQW